MYAQANKKSKNGFSINGGFIGSNTSTELTEGITRRAADWVNQWIAARTLGTAEPPACMGEEALLPEGGALECPKLPGNED